MKPREMVYWDNDPTKGSPTIEVENPTVEEIWEFIARLDPEKCATLELFWGEGIDKETIHMLSAAEGRVLLDWRTLGSIKDLYDPAFIGKNDFVLSGDILHPERPKERTVRKEV